MYDTHRKGCFVNIIKHQVTSLLSYKGITIVFSPSFGIGTTGSKPQKTHLTKVGCVFLPLLRRMFVLLVGIWLLICVFCLLSVILTCLGFGFGFGFGFRFGFGFGFRFGFGFAYTYLYLYLFIFVYVYSSTFKS